MIAGIMSRARSLWRGIRKRSAVEAEMSAEFRAHVELRAEDLRRDGLSGPEALRQARAEFGSPARYSEEARESRGLKRIDGLRFSWLDFKLGLRMLVKYPGLTIVGGIAVAFAICGGAVTFEFIGQVVRPRLPLPDGDRIVALRNWDLQASRPNARMLHDVAAWRSELRLINDIGAAQITPRNLIVDGELGEAVDAAQMSAAAFRVTGVAPLLGRTIIESDELPGAQPVAVISYELWQRRFAADPNVVGRSIGLGRTRALVVGVMPRGYGFPFQQELWTPLQLNALDYARGQGPSLRVFGRLAEGVSLEQAQAELSAAGLRASADHPQTHQYLRPQVMPYAKSWIDLSTMESAGTLSMNLFGVMLLVLVCANVALLVFARAATRESEIIVRNALGASRKRIVMQLFAEALVLFVAATIIGLAAARFGLGWAMHAFETGTRADGGRLPFWIRSTLSAPTVLYAWLLAVGGAAIAGIVPALKITRGLGLRLKEISAGGGGLHFGGIWTAIIVTQVAVTVAVPFVAFSVRAETMEMQRQDPGFPDHEFLSVRLEMDREAPVARPFGMPQSDSGIDAVLRIALLNRYTASLTTLEQRLKADPAVTGVTFARRLPRMYHEWNQVEVDSGAVEPPDARGHRVGKSTIGIEYFDVLGTPVVLGRGFHNGDLAADARAAIVNQQFVEKVLGGRNAIGRRVRYIASESERTPRNDGPWYQIVGVAPDLGMKSGYGEAGIYHPVAHGAEYPMHMAVHLRGRPQSYIQNLRVMAMQVDPALRLSSVKPLSETINGDLQFILFWFKVAALVSAVALLLSLTGIYAIMSFTVARRTREIGIRVALGADARRVVGAIFRRPITQVALGVALGTAFIALLVGFVDDGPSTRQIGVVALYATLMMGVCMLACVVPTRRALRVQPTDALKGDN